MHRPSIRHYFRLRRRKRNAQKLLKAVLLLYLVLSILVLIFPVFELLSTFFKFLSDSTNWPAFLRGE